MKKYLIIIFILIQCTNHKIDALFRDSRIEKLFLEFYEEIQRNHKYEDSDILISSYNSEQGDYLYFSNIDELDLENNKRYIYYSFKGTNVYINALNFPTYLLCSEGKSYLHSLENDTNFPIIKDYIELDIFIKNDTVQYKKLNFDNIPYSDKWIIFKSD